MIRLLIIFITLILVSCRCSTEFISQIDNSKDTLFFATAHMWQGQYEYLSIDLEIKRTDSLFVKELTLIPSSANEKIFPKFIRYEMYSYYFETQGKYKGGPYWKVYTAEKFEKLPLNNRQTNKGDHFIKYSAIYQSDNQIKFENFSADVTVTLIDKKGREVNYKTKLNFYGQRNCRLCVH